MVLEKEGWGQEQSRVGTHGHTTTHLRRGCTQNYSTVPKLHFPSFTRTFERLPAAVWHNAVAQGPPSPSHTW